MKTFYLYIAKTCFLSCIFCTPSFAFNPDNIQPEQRYSLDSITSYYQKNGGNFTENEYKNLIDLSYEYSDNMQFDECESLNIFLLQLFKENLSKEAKVYHVQGYNFARQRKLAEAIESYEKSVELRKKNNDSHKSKELNYTLANLGKVYYDAGDYVKAIARYEEALQVSKAAEDKKLIGLTLSGIGIVLSDQGRYAEALEYLRESTENYKAISDSLLIGRNYFDTGEIKYLTQELDSAMYYFQLSNDIGKRVNDELVVSYCTHRMGSIYLKKKEYNLAEKYLLESLEIRQKLNYPIEIALSAIDLAKLYTEINQYEKAAEFANKAYDLSKETGFLKGVYFSAEILSGIYSKQKKHKEALSFYTEFKQVSDSMFSVEKNQTIEQLNTKIKIDKKTYTLELKHAKQKNLLIFICLILVALIMGIVLYFLRLRKRNKRKYEYRIKERETEAEKQLLLNIYEERRRISRDIHDDLGSSISGIKILSEILFDKTTDPELKQGHQKLLEMQSEVTEKVRDIIWMLNQENNTLEKLMWYCSNYAQKVMNSFGVTVNTINNTAIPPIEIDETTRKNFFLCVKEALNNILKHAKASEIQVEFEYENETFKIEIRDNGKGFNVLTSGEFTNGVSNMKCRMETVDGHFKIRSTTKGTNVILEKNIPLNRD